MLAALPQDRLENAPGSHHRPHSVPEVPITEDSEQRRVQRGRLEQTEPHGATRAVEVP